MDDGPVSAVPGVAEGPLRVAGAAGFLADLEVPLRVIPTTGTASTFKKKRIQINVVTFYILCMEIYV